MMRPILSLKQQIKCHILSVFYKGISRRYIFSQALINQRTNGPVNAHLISGPNLSTKQKKGQEMTLTLNTHFHLLN